MNTNIRDIAFASAMLGLNAVFWRESFKPQYQDTLAQDYGFSPVFFPQIILSIWAILCGVIIIRALLTAKTTEEAPIWKNLFSAIALTAGYIFLVNQAGFLIASIPFAASFMIVFGYRRPVVIASVSLIFPVATWWIFTHPLQIVLPSSPWFTAF